MVVRFPIVNREREPRDMKESTENRRREQVVEIFLFMFLIFFCDLDS